MKQNKKHLKSLAGCLITLFLSVSSLNSAHATATPAGTQVAPAFLINGTSLATTWSAPTAGIFKLWVQIPPSSTAQNATYFVYPKGNLAGNKICSSTDATYPCFQVVIDQSTVSTGWAQLKLNNNANTKWAFTAKGYIAVSSEGISTDQQLGVAQMLFEAGLQIGQSHQGGKIFYLDSTKRHGLIAAPSDQSAGIQWTNGSWANTVATGGAIGTGKANTTAIVQAQGAGSYAAKLCDDLVLNGYSDWYLPSSAELKELYKNKDAVGGFANDYYWSSSEGGNYDAYGQGFEYGNYQDYYKNEYDTLRVRAVRAF